MRQQLKQGEAALLLPLKGLLSQPLIVFAIALGLGGYVYTASGKGKADFKAGMSRDRLLKIAGDTMLASAMGANRPVR